MSESYTASFHNGGLVTDGIDTSGRKRRKLYQACREHNIRDPKYCDKQEHIVKNGHHETWIDIPPKQAYEEIFGEAFKEFNDKQKKKSRKFNSYFEKVKKSKDLVPVREALITIGNCENLPDPEIQKKIYKEYLEQFQKKNPNFVVIGAYYHDDEMRTDSKGNLVKGSPHLHLDYIPVAYKCKRGQKIQNSMNGALLEQGIMNVEIDPEVAAKKFGLRTQVQDEIGEELQTAEKIGEYPNTTEEKKEKITKPRVVTNLIQWTYEQRNLLMKIARKHGLEIENPNEKREHLSTDEYILSKNQSLKREVYSLAEKLLEDLKEVDSEKELMIDWKNDLINKEKANNFKEADLKKKVEEHNEKVKKSEEYFKTREKEAKLKEKKLAEKETFLENAKKHASKSLHKFVSKLKKRKNEIKEKEEKVDEILSEATEIKNTANKLSMSMEDDYYKFTSDIQLVDASRMAMSKDGNGLCKWFEKVGEKFGKWLHSAEYFVKHFWTKTPDEIIKVGEDMKANDCKTLADYIDKSMKASTKKQISQIVDLEVDIPKTRKKISSQIDWWD